MSRTLIDTFVRRLTTLMRGPARLREDIADEIADHLASRIEEETAHAGSRPDAAAIEADAIRAFGDPQAVARELRNIHMGDWIMFQKIMVAALVVIVIGMAATAYFSWSAAHQQHQQLDQMNKQLASLVELQQTAPQRAIAAAAQREATERQEEARLLREKIDAAVSPKAPVYFYLGDKSKPAVDYAMDVEDGTGKASGETTNQDGLIALSEGFHRISGRILSSPGASDTDTGTWSRVVVVDGASSDPILEVDVAPRLECSFVLDLSAITWDREIPRRAKVLLTGVGERQIVHPLRGRGSLPDRSFHRTLLLEWPQAAPKLVAGLYPGKVRAVVSFDPRPGDTKWSEPPTEAQQADWSAEARVTCSAPVDIPQEGGTVTLRLAPEPAARVAGVVFEGSRDHPVSNHSLAATAYANPNSARSSPFESAVVEHLETTSSGEFVRLAMAGPDRRDPGDILEIPWHTADGREARLIWPFDLLESYKLAESGTFYEVDLAKLGTARISFTGAESLLSAGCSLPGPLRLHQIALTTASRSRGRIHTYVERLTRRVDLTSDQRTIDLLLFEPIDQKYSARLELVVAKPKGDAPDLVAHTIYRKDIEFAIKAGEVTDIQVPVNELEEWKASEPTWHRVEAPATQPQAAVP